MPYIFSNGWPTFSCIYSLSLIEYKTRTSSLICKHERVVVIDEEFGPLMERVVIDVDVVDECEIGRWERKYRGGGSGGTLDGE